MGKERCLSFYIISLGATKIAQIKMHKSLMLFVVLILFAGFVGFSRAVYFVISYSISRFTLYSEAKENYSLQKKVAFFKKLTNDYSSELTKFINYEDRIRLHYGMNTISGDIREVGVGGLPTLDELINASFEDPAVREISNIEEHIVTLLRKIAFQDTTFSRMASHVKMQRDLLAQRPSIWPVRGRVTSGFGFRYHPFLGSRVFHEGIDIATEIWTPVFSTADGIASFVGDRGNYGISVKVNHQAIGFTTVYAHLQKAAVEEGQLIKRGEIVGYVGNTGRSTGPHLHYEVRKFNVHVDPMKYILPLDVVLD